MKKTIATKFVHYQVPALESLRDCRAYRLRVKINNSEPLNRMEAEWLTEAVNTNSYSKCGIPVQGWLFDFSDVLHVFWAKQFDHIAEYRATDEMALCRYLNFPADIIMVS